MEFLNGLIKAIMSGEHLMLCLLFIVNIILLLLARPILNAIAPNQDNKVKIRIFQSLNLLVMLLQIIAFSLRQSGVGYEGGYFVNLGISLMTIYGGVFLYSLSGTISHLKYAH